jgi:sugar lactone lactonase YvrE
VLNFAWKQIRRRRGTGRASSNARTSKGRTGEASLGKERSFETRQLLGCISALGLLVILVTFGSVSALAEVKDPSNLSLPSSDEVIQAIEAEESGEISVQPTDAEAAEDLPHQDLGRGEALELLQSVFEVQLEAPAGIFNDLDIQRFLTPNIAVIPGTEPPTAVSTAAKPEVSSAAEEGEGSEPSPLTTMKEELRAPSSNTSDEGEAGGPNAGQEMAQVQGATLLQSSIPLRAETSSGEPEAVDLDLEQANGELQPANPLVEVGIPQHLGEGIELPGVGVTIEVVGAPEDRSPSIVEGSVAFMPNIAPDTDLAVAPTPTGIETFTQLRSADSPLTQTYALQLPNGAALHATEDGGAVVVQEEETLLSIAPPSAIDATGTDVPVDLDVSGDSFTLATNPDESAQLPILVDPLIQTYEWANAKWWESGICSNSTKYEGPSFSCTNREEWGYEVIDKDGSLPSGVHVSNQAYSAADPVPYGTTGLVLDSSRNSSGMLTTGDRGSTIYTVPRYFTDQSKYGERPTSFISHMTLWNLDWNAWSSSMSPYLFAGIWDPFKPGWVSYYSHEGLSGHSVHNMSWKYEFSNGQSNTNAKVGYVSIQATSTGPNQNTEAYVGSASIQLSDLIVPTELSTSGPSTWVDKSTLPLTFSAKDSGLGVYSLTVSTEQLAPGGAPLYSWKTRHGCIGVSGSPCPRIWKSVDPGLPALKYEPSVLPTGINYLLVSAEDPVGNKSGSVYAEVKVDHTAPQISFSGTMTEQAALGLKRPTYTLRADAADGTTESPQSGVVKTLIKVDGTKVDEVAPGCTTKNCAISREWTLDASKYSAGQHTVTVTATDAVGLSSTKTLTINLDPSPPNVALSGTMTEQATLGNTRPRYKLKVDATAIAGVESPQLGQPTFASAFGSAGTGAGQLSHPAGVATDAQGNVWVVDQNNNRVQKFSESGQYLASFGSSGTGNGQFSRPTSIAIDAKGNLWVTDAGNSRIEKFSPSGTYLSQLGSYGTGTGQFKNAEGIAIDPKGNIWVADTYNGRLQKFDEAGQFVKAVGSYGSAEGQLGEPTDLDIGPGGSVWVADWQNNRVAVFDEAGLFVRQFGTAGAGNGQFNRPDVIDVDMMGNVWVGDQNNGRVQAFSQSGEYLTQFGAKGSGQGQFSFSWPMGITTDSKGRIWIADTNNNRIQRWQIPNYVPSYGSSFGSLGGGNGQFNQPAGAAVDAKGNLWVADKTNNRIQRFNAKGEFVSKFGSFGSADGQLSSPSSVAVDLEGNIWVVDTGNNRIQKFNAAGEFLSKFGSTGSGNGQFQEPIGIAVHPGNGWIYVVDRGNNRVQLFGKGGAFLGKAGSYGSGPNQYIEPSGIAIGRPPGGGAVSLYVVDTGNHRVQKSNGLGTDLGAFGLQGAGAGQFDRPSAVDVDSLGNVWVVDQNNGRVQKFNEAGEYITQFGAKGSGQGQFGSTGVPTGIAADYAGNIWIADSANNRIQRWTQPDLGSDILTEVTVDGKQVDSGEGGCLEEQCLLSREWILPSSGYSVGQHSVVAKATDGLGNTTSKSLSIDIQRDTTKPTLEAGGELLQAPEGWVEQESYGLNASAIDNGHGITSLALRIDGQEVAALSQPCADGGCPANLTKPIDMSPYAGGAHMAELIATDGAGNATSNQWTLNVDPQGHITASEVQDTLDAVDDTSESTIVAPTSTYVDPAQQASGYNPSLAVNEGELESVDTPNISIVSSEPEDGFTVYMPEAVAHAEPVSVNEGATAATVAAGAVAVTGNTTSNVDTVIRPVYDGVLTFQAIRDKSAPESYSWDVNLGEGQTLQSVDSKTAKVTFDDGRIAMLIMAEPAHDAVGTDVPTSLTVSNGHVLTLTVSHAAANHVYPVVAGAGWKGGFTTELIEGPKDEQELKEERERILKEEQEALEAGGSGEPGNELEFHGVVGVSAPEPIGAGDEASASATGRYKRHFRYIECTHTLRFGHLATFTEACGNPFQGDPGVAIAFRAAYKGKYFVKPNQKVWHEGGPNDSIFCFAEGRTGGINSKQRDGHVDRCVWWGATGNGNGGASATVGHHITPVGRFIGESRGSCGNECGQPNPWEQFEMPPMAFYLWPDGSAVFHQTNCIDC